MNCYQLLVIFIEVCSVKSMVCNVGFLINDDNLSFLIKETIRKINQYPASYDLGSCTLNASWHILPEDPVQATKGICEKLIENKVLVIITTNAVNASRTPNIVPHVASFYNIPVIALEGRDSEFSDKKKYPTLLRTVPPYFEQAEKWTHLLNYFKWNKVNLVTSNDYDGYTTYVKFLSWANKFNIVIEKKIMFPSAHINLTSYLRPLQKAMTKVIILACSERDALSVYRASSELAITGDKYIWITSEQAISGDALEYAPQGLLALRIYKKEAKDEHMTDAIRIVSKALGILGTKELLANLPPSSCNQPAGQWTYGETVYKSLVQTAINGSSGTVNFDWYGDRNNSIYEVINIRKEENKSYTVPVGIMYDGKNISVNMKDIVWPGNTTSIDKNIFASFFHLRIVTLESHPFVYVIKMPASGNCSHLDEIKIKNGNRRLYRHIPCSGPSKSVAGRHHCCKGLCMDLLWEISERENFTYDIHLTEDGKYGTLNKVNGTNMKRWNGMMGDLVEGKADLIMAALTINNDRAQYIEFSKPFKYIGITVLVRKTDDEGSLDSFLQPFQWQLWVLVLIAVHVVAAILYLLDRFSPFGPNRYEECKTEKTALNLSNAMWFSWGVLLNSGIGEGIPKSFSARVLSLVWAGFAMIIVASYTANLAAFLVLDRPKPIVSGIDDPVLRNPTPKFLYATVINSSVENYFRRQVELSNMYKFMEKHNLQTEQQGIDMVINGTLKAFIWDSPILLHAQSKNCVLTTVGELFGRSGYGLGMAKGSLWSNAVSMAVLYLHENGKMEELDAKWIDYGHCKAEKTKPTLGLKHMLGVFIMVAIGIGTGIVILILEILYYKKRGWKKKEGKVLKKTASKWQAHVKEIKSIRGDGINSRKEAANRTGKQEDITKIDENVRRNNESKASVSTATSNPAFVYDGTPDSM